MLSQSAQDYLKTIWSISEWDGSAALPTDIARRMDLSPSTVTEAVKKLASSGLVEHKRYGPVRLTDSGQREALQIVRKHRLIESFLHNHLGYSWEELHEEAEKLEHTVSDHFVERIDALLGHPEYDPHGDPIPRSDGTMPSPKVVLLTDAPKGAQLEISQVDDDDADILIYLRENGITPTTAARVISQAASLGLTTVRIGAKEIALPEPAARRIRVIIKPER